MKILIDVTEITPYRLYSSIPIYIMRFLSTIKAQEIDEYILLINEDFRYFFEKKYPGFQLLSFKFKGWNKFWHSNPKYKRCILHFNKFLIKNNIDVIFIPTDYPFYLQEKLCCKKVVVVHDLKGIKRNTNSINECLEAYYINNMYRRHLESADEIIAVSKYTKQDIQIYYPQINEEKIHVVYNSVQIATNVIQPPNFTNKKYILFVNTLQKYKNIETLIKAYLKLEYRKDYKLVIVGKITQYWSDEVLPLINRYKIQENIILLQGISNEELRYLYENASVFVTTSLNEGFGYTPIEAALCKCPVISSIQEALPDSTQGLLNYYQPAMDDNALVKQLRHVLEVPPSSEQLDSISLLYKDLYSIKKQTDLIKKILKYVR